jgi:hypothetical protein
MYLYVPEEIKKDINWWNEHFDPGFVKRLLEKMTTNH